MRSSGEIAAEMEALVADKKNLSSIKSLLSDFASKIRECSGMLRTMSNTLYEGYHDNEARLDGRVLEHANGYESYAQTIDSICDAIDTEITLIDSKLVDLDLELREALAREEAARRALQENDDSTAEDSQTENEK